MFFKLYKMCLKGGSRDDCCHGNCAEFSYIPQADVMNMNAWTNDTETVKSLRKPASDVVLLILPFHSLIRSAYLLLFSQREYFELLTLFSLK